MSLVGLQIGSIRIERPLGEGGMGEVYLGFDEKLERRVAVKTLRSGQRLDADAKARLVREARLLSKLGHPAICQIYDLIEGEGADYLVLEYVEGTTLRQFAGEKPAFERLLSLCRQIAEGLAAAHREKIIHRDLKAENVMVTAGDRAKILDFGVARAADAEVALHPPQGRPALSTPVVASLPSADTLPAGPRASGPDFQTRIGTIVGTLHCMSPEQALGRTLTPASDLFSFGILMQELFTGHPAYPEAPVLDLLAAVQSGASSPATGLDEELAHLIEEMKSFEPRVRPTADEVALRLERLIGKPARRQRRRRWIAAGIAGVASLVVGLLVVSYLALEASRARRESERRQGQAEDLIGFMLEDLRPKLEKVGRLDLLDAVGERALDHFQAVPESELSPTELSRRIQALRQLAEVRFAQGALDSARVIAERARGLAEVQARARPTAENEHALALAATMLGGYWTDLEEPAKAFPLFEQALAAARRARALAPQDRELERLLASALSDTGVGLKALGRTDEAIARFAESEGHFRRLLAAAPSGSDAATASELSTTLAWASSALEEAGRFAEATVARRENLVLLERIARASGDPAAQNDLATGRDFLARLLLAQGKPEEAAREQRLAQATFVELAERDPENSDWARSAAVAHLNLGWILADLGDLRGAAAELRRGSAGLEMLRRLHPGHRAWNRMLAVTQYRQAVVALEQGDRATAGRRIAESVALLEDLAREAPADATIALRLAESLGAAAGMAAADDRASEAAAMRARAEEILAQRAGPRATPQFQAAYAQLLISAQRIEEARAILERLRAMGYRPRRLEAAARGAGI
jgi:tetratricopeptide (TPR) repeat protein